MDDYAGQPRLEEQIGLHENHRTRVSNKDERAQGGGQNGRKWLDLITRRSRSSIDVLELARTVPFGDPALSSTYSSKSNNDSVQSHSKFECKLKKLTQFLAMAISSSKKKQKNQQLLGASQEETCRTKCVRNQSAPELLLRKKGWKSRLRTSVSTAVPLDIVCDATVAVSESSSDGFLSPSNKNPDEINVIPCHISKKYLKNLFEICNIVPIDEDQVIEVLISQFGTCNLDMIAFESLVGDRLVSLIGILIFEQLQICNTLADRLSLLKVLDHVQPRYLPENPFHNACHAADVMHGLFMMLSSTQLVNKISKHNQLAVLLAAIMHDIEHVGLTNDFLLKSKHEIALAHPGKIPMETMHATVAETILLDPRTNLLGKLTENQRSEVLQIVRESILSTALSSQKTMLEQVRELCKQYKSIEDTGAIAFDDQLLILRLVTHVCDIGQTMKPFALHEQWVSRLKEENFLEGDTSKRLDLGFTPASCDRSRYSEKAFLESQIFFLENFAMPAIKALNEVPWMNVDSFVEGVTTNTVRWKKQLEELKCSS